MSEWLSVKLGELTTYKKGFAFKSKDFRESGRRIIKVRNFTNNSIDISDSDFLDPALAKNYEQYSLQTKDVVIATVGSWPTNPASVVGKVVRVPNDASNSLLNQNAVRLRSNGKILADYLYYQLKTNYFASYLISGAQGSANQASITLEDIFSYAFCLPPLHEQEAITAVLASLDDKIDLLHRQNKTLESLAQTLFRHWFLDGAADDWEVVTIGDFAQINASTVRKDYQHDLIEYLDTGSITEGKISGFQQYTLGDAPSRAKRLVQHNDIIFSTVRPNQKHYGIIKNPQPNLVVSTGFCVVTCDRIDPHFVYLLLTQPDMTEYLHSIAEGSTSAYPSLKPSDIASLKFQLPPNERLDEFSTVAQSCWKKIDHNSGQIRTLENLRDTILPKLMSGEVRVRL